MTVHVGEIHTEVAPVATTPGAAPVEAEVVAAAVAAASRTAWLADRVAAEAFDD